ncbi:MAG: hypothetical protein B9S32_05310 [Verrucomicrobia bacterium Tous-C9LFEB]|nr:MAG: hypothetical protein B9S32_05310 [Verrucomicrobia bacterium Tous-C9LFEB]
MTAPLPCILWHTEGTAISGLFSWMHRLKQTLPAAGVRLELASMEIQPFRFTQVADIDAFYDHRIRTGLELVAFLKKNRHAVHLINHAFDYVTLAHQLSAPLLAQSRLVGICHTDQDYYYQNLQLVDSHLRGIIAVSPLCALKLGRQLPHRAGTMPILPDWDMPIPPPRIHSPSAKAPLRLLFNGRLLHLQKRVLDLPPLLELLAQRGVPAELTIAGDGPDLPKLQSALHAQTAIPVRFTGALPPWEMEALLESHDLFLQLSEFEGASVSLMEAMLHGLAPVVTAIDSGTELLIDEVNALLAPVGNLEAMADRIESLHHQRARIPRLAQAAYETAATHLRELNYPQRFASYMKPFTT